MPNHITNSVSITHTDPEQIKWLRVQFVKEGDSEVIDFDKLIPMPQELRDTVSPTKVVATQAEADKINAKHMKNKTPSSNEKFEAISNAEKTRRLTEYGAVNWYDWACAKWGTKWGAYSGRIEKETENAIHCVFDTAWSPPEPIFDLLREKGFELNGYWIDEGDSEAHEIGDEDAIGNWCVRTSVEFCG